MIDRTGAVGILCFVLAWLALYSAEPWEAGGDIYDHLSVARNVTEGRGLKYDVVYPLTTTFEWGRELPQPQLHRPPG